MIFFLLGNLCMKIVNSVVVVGLYYGFLTTFSIGPSYLVLFRTLVMEEGEEGAEKKVAATTGFIMGQLMMFISIYYTPLHLALGRPHTITFLALPYILFNFFWSNHFDYGSTTRNSMRNLSIQCVFLNNLIFQLFNHFVLPSSMLARLVNIYMFRCNNKMLFVTSSFVGWLIGHILFMKCVGLIFVWIRQNFYIRSIIRSNTYLLNVLIRAINVPIRSKRYKKYKSSVSELKYLVSELKYFVLDLIDSMDRIFSILLFISCVYSLGRMPSPIFSRKLKETSKTTERGESEKERDVEIETTFETKGTKQEQEGFTEEDPSPSPFSEEREDPDKIDETERIRVNGKDKTKDKFHFHLKEEDKDLFWFEKPAVNLLFDYKRWNRPLRYIKNSRFEHAVRNEMSQYFFYTCQSDGKRRISFTYPSSLSAFFEMLRQKMYFSFFTTKKFVCDELDKFFYDELHNSYCWIYTNEKKWRNLRNEFRDRIEALDRGSPYLDVLEKKTRLCNNQTKEEYLPKIYDPLLNGSYRGIINKFFLPSILNETSVKNSIETNFINKLNKVHSILLFKGKELNVHNFEELYHKLEGKIATLEEKLVQKLDQKLEEKLGQKIYTLDKKALARELSFLIDEFAEESTSNLKGISLFPEQRRIDSEDPEKVLKFLIERVIIDPIIQTICDTAIIPPMEKTTRKKSIGINKKVPQWSYKLFSEVEQLGKTATTEEGEEWIVDHQIRSRKAKRIVLFTRGPEEAENADPSIKTMTKPDEIEEVDMIDYPYEADFRRDIITGSMRVQRRKTLTGKMFPLYPYSPLFFDRVGFSWDVLFEPFILSVIEIYDLIQDIFRKGIKGSVAKRIKRLKKKKKMYMEENKSYEEIQKEVNEMEKGRDGQTEMERIERTRERISDLYDILIYAHGIRALILLIQSRLRQSIVLPSLILAKNIVRFLLRQESEWEQDIREMNKEVYVICTYNGLPVLEPGRNGIFPQNWATEGIQIMIRFPFRLKPWHRSKIRPSHRDQNAKQESPAAFLTIWGLETDRPFGSPLVGLGILFSYYFGPPLKKLQKAIRKWSFRVLKSFKERTKFLFLKVPKEQKKWREDSSEIKKDSIINNQIIHESSIQTRSMDWTNYSLTEIKMKDLTDRTSTIRNQIERITKDKTNGFRTLKINMSPNKTSYGAQKLASLKNLFQIFKRRNDRLIRKSHYFLKWIVERIYTDILLESFPYIINRLTNSLYRPMIIIKLFRKFKKKYIFDTKEKKIIERLSTIQKKLSPSRIRHKIQTKSGVSFKLSLVSQAYVFYKLSQTQVINLYKLRSVLQYDGASLFLKNEIKDSFRRQGIISYELKHNKLHNSGRNQWKNWLKSHYPYDFSEQKWSKLVPQKWRNRVNQHCRVENPNLIKRDSSEREEKVSLLLNKNDHFQKMYRYDLLAYQSIYYEDKKDSYNYNIHKPKFVDMGASIPITHFIRKDYFMYIKNPDRKYLDTKGLFYLKINKDKEINPSNQKKKRNPFDWMGMNEERLNRPVSKPIPWLFPQFELFFNVYKMKPGFIPIHSLLFHLNEDVSQKKNITKKKKGDLLLSNEKEKKYFELENQEEKKTIGQRDLASDAQNRGNPESVLSNQQKYMEELYTKSDMKMGRTKKKSKSIWTWEIDLDAFMKGSFALQLKWLLSPLTMEFFDYALSVLEWEKESRMTTKFGFGFIKKEELTLDPMLIRDLNLSKILKEGIFIIEPVRIPVKHNVEFLMYQTIRISLVHEIKQKKNQKRYREIMDKNHFEESIARHQMMTKNINKNHYDLLVPENLLSSRRRRELRILSCFNSRNSNCVDKNAVFCNGNKVKTCGPFLDESKDLDRDKMKLMKLKFFLWPNYRLEDLACMNRYWFDTNNGSRFSMLRIHMYPRLKID